MLCARQKGALASVGLRRSTYSARLCLLLGCRLCGFSGVVRGARHSIGLLGSFSGLLDALGGSGHTCALFYSFCATLPSSKQRGKTDHGGGSGSRAPHPLDLMAMVTEKLAVKVRR